MCGEDGKREIGGNCHATATDNRLWANCDTNMVYSLLDHFFSMVRRSAEQTQTGSDNAQFYPRSIRCAEQTGAAAARVPRASGGRQC